jgi:hypothetical protein
VRARTRTIYNEVPAKWCTLTKLTVSFVIYFYVIQSMNGRPLPVDRKTISCVQPESYKSLPLKPIFAI